MSRWWMDISKASARADANPTHAVKMLAPDNETWVEVDQFWSEAEATTEADRLTATFGDRVKVSPVKWVRGVQV